MHRHHTLYTHASTTRFAVTVISFWRWYESSNVARDPNQSRNSSVKKQHAIGRFPIFPDSVPFLIHFVLNAPLSGEAVKMAFGQTRFANCLYRTTNHSAQYGNSSGGWQSAGRAFPSNCARQNMTQVKGVFRTLFRRTSPSLLSAGATSKLLLENNVACDMPGQIPYICYQRQC